jgi:hypothetical protein
LTPFRAVALAAATLLTTDGWSICRAQSASSPGPDTLLFNDGEKLIGHLERSTDTKVTFKSDMAGEITVDWSKVQELPQPTDSP